MELNVLKSTNLNNKFSNNLLYLRKTNGYSQEDVAGLLGNDTSSISKYENGTTWPSVPNLIKIAKLFNTSVDFLLFEDMEENNKVHSDFMNAKKMQNVLPFGDNQYKKYEDTEFYLCLNNNNELSKKGITTYVLSIGANTKDERFEISLKSDSKIKLYSGYLVLTNFHIYIYVNGITNYERTLITMYRPNNDFSKKYIGGIGIMSNVSQGFVKAPCLQKCLLVPTKISNILKYEHEILELLKCSTRNGIIKLSGEEDIRTYYFIKQIITTPS